MSGELNKEIKRIANLKQNKNASDALIEQQAKLNVWKRQINIESRFSTAQDKELASKLFNDYIENYEFDGFSDLNTLSDLIFEEVLKQNIQKQITKITDDDSNNYISDKTIKSLHDVESRVLELKLKLGVIKTDDEKADDLTALQQLEKRMDKYIEFHRSRVRVYLS